MIDGPKITIIGAGSASFGLENLTGILNNRKFQNSAELVLVDINEPNLLKIFHLAKLINREWKSNIKISMCTNRKEALPDSDFVILSVAQDREDTWFKDYKIGIKHNIWHYAENGGPGSFGHTARGLAFIIPILTDIHDLIPDAWLINFTNPLPRIGYAAQKAGVKFIGLCHQIWHGYGILGRYLAKDLEITSDLDLEYKWTDENQGKFANFTSKAIQEYNIKAAGLNHFTWMLEIKKKSTGEEMYPRIKNEAKNINRNFEPLTQKMFEIFGFLPVPGDCHLAEYLPYTYKKENWSQYNIQLYDFNRGKKQRMAMWTKINNIISNKQVLDLTPNYLERGDEVIAAIAYDDNTSEQAVNIINHGVISNLPRDAIIELPASLNKNGPKGIKIGKLPEGIAALCVKEISIAKLITDASIEGDRLKALQAFSLMLDDLQLAENLLNDYLSEHKKYLPQFFKA
ncbi:MAG: hypothetical protein EAX86_06185 [Candidatus Heimdallarchaeota archaeon]|nr:hypothetical protein [Candidatus Heimdallarchaeota archaeon]